MNEAIPGAMEFGSGMEITGDGKISWPIGADGGTEAQKKLLGLVDVLVGGPFPLARRSLELAYCGSGNQRVIDVPRSLRSGAVVPAPPRWQGEY